MNQQKLLQEIFRLRVHFLGSLHLAFTAPVSPFLTRECNGSYIKKSSPSCWNRFRSLWLVQDLTCHYFRSTISVPWAKMLNYNELGTLKPTLHIVLDIFSSTLYPPVQHIRFWDKVASPNCPFKWVKMSEDLTPSLLKTLW